MDTKAPRSYVDHLAWFVPAVIGILGLVLDHLDMARWLLSKIWEALFVNIWYLWVAGIAFGLFRLVRLIRHWHVVTTDTIPALIRADSENRSHASHLVTDEANSRVSANDTLSQRINTLDSQLRNTLKLGLNELETRLSSLVASEAKKLAGRIDTIGRQVERDSKRLNAIQEIPALRQRLEAAEAALPKEISPPPELRPSLLDMLPPSPFAKGVINRPTLDEAMSLPPPPSTQQKALIDVLEEFKKKKSQK